jgi:hypothetical protein
VLCVVINFNMYVSIYYVNETFLYYATHFTIFIHHAFSYSSISCAVSSDYCRCHFCSLSCTYSDIYLALVQASYIYYYYTNIIHYTTHIIYVCIFGSCIIPVIISKQRQQQRQSVQSYHAAASVEQ